MNCDASTPPDPTVAPVVIPPGNNILNIVSGTYTGLPNSFEIQGDGNNTITMTGGSVSGGILTGNGQDHFDMRGGTVSGHINQGVGGSVDTFTMSGGTVGSLEQGGGLDTFMMTGGTILGAFTEGDFITVTGGSIGSVNMTIGNNVFTMSGGQIVGDVIGGGDNDTFSLSGGAVGGNVNLGNGSNRLTVSGGSIGNGITTGTGSDRLTWSGGTISNAINLGAGDDQATLANLTNANLATTTLVDGGAGNDKLTFANSTVGGIAQFQNWETIALTQASRVTLDSNLTLGGADTQTGTLSIDSSSTLYAAGYNNAIVPFTAGQLAEVDNAGTIDLVNGATGDSVTVVGNYVGQGGTIRLDTFLNTTGSPSDKLIIDTGVASGSSGLFISNVGGPGAVTEGNGILVVDTANGATTTGGAFSMANPGGYAAAGPYAYRLFRGSTDGSNPDAWYLRSTVDCTINPSSPACTVPDTPDYRPETSLYSALPAMIILYGWQLFDTLHERIGQQTAAGSPAESSPHAWGRVIGAHGDHLAGWRGTYGDGPGYDYDFFILQVGNDVYENVDAAGRRTRAGFYIAAGDGSGDVASFDGSQAGHNRFQGMTLGGYWTYYDTDDSYLDAVVQGTMFDATAESGRVPLLTTHGPAFAASLEAGHPLAASSSTIIEPQAQLVYQAIDLSTATDTAAEIKFGNVESLVGRVGVRFAHTWLPYSLGASPVTAWVRPNLWYEFLGNPKTAFSSSTGFIPFFADLGGSSVEINTGVTAQLSEMTSIYANASYEVGIGENADGHAYDGKLGIKVGW